MAADELFLLFESAPGLLLARVKAWDQLAQDSTAVQEACLDFPRFAQVVEAAVFHPFADAEEALEVQLAVTSGKVCPAITNFLNFNLPSPVKRHKKRKGEAGDAFAGSSGGDGGGNVTAAAIGVADAALGKSLSEAGFRVVYNANIAELLRGCRQHLRHLVGKQLHALPLEKFQVGLGHSYSRSKMQEDPRMQDKPVMQAVALLDTLDKNINAFAMKLKEWYGWHFPELVKVVGEVEAYCHILNVVRIKENFNETECGDALLEACGGSDDICAEVLFALKHSMGQEMDEAEFQNISKFAEQILHLCEERKSLQTYLSSKMDFVSPNLKAVVGEVLAARLISHAGALTNLAKYPASTIQILGAEKALFRALKAKSGRTPKYGLLFHSSFIGRVQKQQHRGRMSRYLAAKCALAARIDAFSDGVSGKGANSTKDSAPTRSNIYGLKLREQLEERLKYLSDGITPRKNLDVMREAASEVQAEAAAAALARKKSKKKKKKKHGAEAEETENARVDNFANPLIGDDMEGKKTKKKSHKQRAKHNATEGLEAEGSSAEPPLRRM